MIDLGISKLALIGIVALIVIGPERLPRVARTVGAFVGKAQRYVSEVKDEVSRSMDLEDLKKMRQEVEDTARQVQGSVKDAASDFERSWKETEAEFDQDTQRLSTQQDWEDKSSDSFVTMRYVHPKKNWRLKRSAVPTWYKRRSGLPTKALSGAARVAKHKPKNTTRSA